MSKGTITIELAPKLGIHKRRQPWIFNYKENDLFGFGGWNGKGGMTRARTFAKQLKMRMKTNPEIIEKHKD